MARKLRILTRMVASSLERGRSSHFEPGGSDWFLLSNQHFEQILEFSLPLHACVDVSPGLDVPASHSGHLNLLSGGQKHYSRTSHERRNVR